MGFDHCNLLFENSRIHGDFHSQSGSPLGRVRVHSLTFSHTPRTLFHVPESIRCDFQASFLARTLVSPCLGHKPKARVMTQNTHLSLLSLLSFSSTIFLLGFGHRWWHCNTFKVLISASTYVFFAIISYQKCFFSFNGFMCIQQEKWL
jgi:hypothetical protein